MSDLVNFDISRFEASVSVAAKLLRALANERRLMILCQLSGGERAVGDLQPLVGLSQSALSQHLAVLREEGVVATRRAGQVIWYRIADPAALQVVATLAHIFCPPDMKDANDSPTDTLEPRRVAERLRKGHASLVDVREPDKFPGGPMPGAIRRPLSAAEKRAASS